MRSRRTLFPLADDAVGFKQEEVELLPAARFDPLLGDGCACLDLALERVEIDGVEILRIVAGRVLGKTVVVAN